MDYFDNEKFAKFFNELTATIADIPDETKNTSVYDIADEYEIPLDRLPEETRIILEPYLNVNLYNPGGSGLAAKGCVACLGCLACAFCGGLNVGAVIVGLVGILHMAPD